MLRVVTYRLSQILLHRKTSSGLQASTHATGRAHIPRRIFSCQSYQGQHAHEKHAGPDISGLDLGLQQQWDHAANAQLGNIVIQPRSATKVTWICDQCPDGHLHSWSAQINSRSDGSGCPQCSGLAVCKHNSLATKAPLIAAQWDYEANDGTPETVTAQTAQSVGWHCDVCGHKWSATPHARVSKRKTGCPQCAQKRKTKTRTQHPTFAESKHPLLAEWDHKQNAAQGHFPDKIRLKSHKQIFWFCTKCPAGQQHRWSAVPYDRTGRVKPGCPFCSGRTACGCNSLQARYPDIAAEWDPTKKQGQPSDYPAGSTFVAWWSSRQRGSWQQTIHSRTGYVQRKATRLRRIQERQSSAGLRPGPPET
ncbi:hypothetical protein ABBQ38_004435 [Trebouxia sp. C0009 RCD-2024]